MEYIETKKFGILITLNCSLKCKRCSVLVPYLKKKYDPPIELLRDSLDAYFKIVNKTGTIDISGGETFLCGTKSNFRLGEILEYLTATYSGRYDRIRIFTNGTTVPSDELCEVFKKISDVKPLLIVIDDYGVNSTKIDEIAEKLKHYDITPDIRDYSSKSLHCDGWVDLKPSKEKLRSKEQTKIQYSKCAWPRLLGGNQIIFDGAIFLCLLPISRYLSGMIDKSHEDIIDLLGGESIEALREKQMAYLTFEEPIDSCGHCRHGLCEDAERFMPAEQATAEDIEQWVSSHDMRY
jgi:hypothetical protein